MSKDRVLGIYDKLIKIKNYDHGVFLLQLEHWINELSFFYNIVVKDGQDPSKVIYDIPFKQRPIIGQVAYFNLRRGYPKETYDGHWCYILSDYGSKFVILPITSEKGDSLTLNIKYEMYIDIKDFENNEKSRLQLTDIRSIDIMRVYKKKKIYNTTTDRALIIEKVKEILFS